VKPIVLGPVPHLICQCEGCGRVRLDRAWVRADWIVPDVVGMCPTCGEVRRRVTRWREARDVRRAEERKARGFGPAPAGIDPFKGFRAEGGAVGTAGGAGTGPAPSSDSKGRVR